ncbi:hypothetical protein GF385_04330 [Candidatus Dependentiae bacterium]|nr:hypothetical protein [Candidatus Dependentiae bacterium]
MKKCIFSLIFIFFISLFLSENIFSKNFIVSSVKQKNQRSKSSIKEDIGINIKNALNNCADLNKKIAEIQIKLSDIQKQLFGKVEDLIDNKKPFKKSSRSQLKSSLDTMEKINRNLKYQLNGIKNLQTKLNKDYCLKKNT